MKGTGWIEVLGSGWYIQNVPEAAGVDSSVYGGFAFGLGQDRIAMLKYGIDDIRSLYKRCAFLKPIYERIIRGGRT